MIKSLSRLAIIAVFMTSDASAFIGKVLRRGDKMDEEVKLRPPPVYKVDYIEQPQKDRQSPVVIDLTTAANRKLDLLRTGWVVHQGQKIIVSDFELKAGSNFVWEHDYSSCKDSYGKKDQQQQSQPGYPLSPVGTTTSNKKGVNAKQQPTKGGDNATIASKPKKKMKIPIPVMLYSPYTSWSRIKYNQNSLRIRGPAANAFWHLSVPKEDRVKQRRGESPGIRQSHFQVYDFTKTQYRKRRERTPYVLENDIKCQIKMTLRKRIENSKKANDPNTVWRRLNINLLIKADKSTTEEQIVSEIEDKNYQNEPDKQANQQDKEEFVELPITDGQ